MDYHAIHGHDRASFDTSGAHRLPTVSASQALDELGSDASNHVSTGLEDLDHALAGTVSVDSQDSTPKGGVHRGQVTEIWGPPGTGKTALGLQLASNALRDGNAVVWVDCFQAIPHNRLKAVINTIKDDQGDSDVEAHDVEVDAGRFLHYSCLTLPHFVALISRPTAKAIPANSSLVVISSLSALVNSALPKSHDGKAISKSAKGPSPSTKRLQALQSIMNALHKLAATRNCAVVILSQCATKMHSERGATLTAAVNATVWEQGVSTRLVVFRDWVWQEGKLASVFLAGLQKVDGKASQETVENVVAFKVELVCQASCVQAGDRSHEDGRTAWPRFPTKRFNQLNWPGTSESLARRSSKFLIVRTTRTTDGQMKTKRLCRPRRLSGKAARTSSWARKLDEARTRTVMEMMRSTGTTTNQQSKGGSRWVGWSLGIV
ncbi:hypothetical protein NW754_001017 [Fusarium falciforme]|uniref:RecA family profile 1 domain-containing protein n=1 Tax=Fusarium falciforme TaxID=195108 RepID=A0A9W8V357_9HYPO|nr:hypothetical protein NW754_001017 [Fusarium falciforme]KAJ4189798.1 hypothetical protein NW755_005795 [Fusarium falciforme]KAJ4210160.1 hypothetical protein NW767_000431 [Fusarium falciforme]KAJ4256370.1 hypothetical protein NW757_004001 [Fusarium falciforme]